MNDKWASSKTWVKTHVSQADMSWAVKAAQTLIKLEPANPPGNELAAARWAAAQLESAGFDVKLDVFGEDRANVFATYGNADDIGIALYGHLDVVPVFGEPTEPAGSLKGGFLYGRGSADMLGGCAAILSAARVIARSGRKGQKGVAVLFVSDEEQLNGGMKRVFDERKPDGVNLSALEAADVAVVAEPTQLQVQLGNRGFTSFFIRATGKAAHSSSPHEGENAIYKMARIVSRLEQFCADLAPDAHKWLGPSTLNVGKIRGGLLLNTIPDFCEIEVERRILPGTSPDMSYEEFRRIVGEDGEVVRRSTLYPSWIDEDHPLTMTALDAVGSFSSQGPRPGAFIGCTEAGYFSDRFGIPTVLLGPGSIAQAHRENEFCEAAQIEQCVGIFAALTHFYMK